ncbi:MAG: hypothetical protein ABSE99_13520 [Terracidiphilus sp.]|jgi:hypothetical protein
MTQSTPIASSVVSSNPAVARCLSAWEPVYRAALAKGRYKVHAADDAAQLYRDAMPPLSGYENIRDFIACTAHGILVGAIDATDASKLLYAAQVALTTLRSQPSPPVPPSPLP